jgi:hypothetical protein
MSGALTFRILWDCRHLTTGQDAWEDGSKPGNFDNTLAAWRGLPSFLQHMEAPVADTMRLEATFSSINSCAAGPHAHISKMKSPRFRRFDRKGREVGEDGQTLHVFHQRHVLVMSIDA